MKILLSLSFLIVMSSSAFAYDPSLLINVKKVTNLLSRAKLLGKTADGTKCEAEIRRIEDGYYTLLIQSEGESIFIGLDLDLYGKPASSWTKRTFTLRQSSEEGSQFLFMKEDFASKKLSIFAEDEFTGVKRSIHCLLPLIH